MRRTLALLLLSVAALAGCKAKEGTPLRRLDDGEAGFEVKFKGNETFGDRDLLKIIEPSLGDFIESDHRKFAVDDAAAQIELYYNEEGFPLARVEYEVLEQARGPLLRFKVEEGTRCLYGVPHIVGEHRFTAEELARLVPARGSGLLGLGPKWLVISRLESGRSAIESLYYESGFLDVRVDYLGVRYEDEGRRGVALYAIVEGPQSVLDAVLVEGLPATWGREVTDEAYGERIGEAWFPRVGFEIRARIEGLCADRGFPDAVATVEVKEHERVEKGQTVKRIVLHAQVETGPLVRVRSVEVRGNEKTRTAFIRRRLKLEPGDPFSREKVDDAFKTLYRTGIFEQLRISLEGDDPHSRDVVIDVVEGPKWEFWAQPGWGSYEKLRLSAGFVDKNLFGTGRRLGGEASVSSLSQEGKLQFTEPTLLGPDNELRFELYGLHRIEPSFTREEYGTGVQVRHEWNVFLDTIVRYDLLQTRSTDVEVVTPIGTPDPDSNIGLSLVTLSLNHDRRDSKFLPTRGGLTRGAIEISNEAIGSELDYLRLLASHFRYLPLGERTTLAAGVRTGVLLAAEDVEFPLQLRFFNGGENTVRSFREQELGPKDVDGNPVGGEVYNVFNLELRRRLVSQIEGATFFDAGNVLLSSSDYGSFSDISTGIGVGLRWLLPIGPVRLDFAVNPDPLPDEASYVLHFSLGTAF